MFAINFNDVGFELSIKKFIKLKSLDNIDYNL